MDQDLFKPSISLWQHYVTIISVGGLSLAYSFGSGWMGLAVAVTFLVGAVVDGCQSGERS
ncbi:hypothetical protein [Pseudomonas agarici]|uniref:hypothetical protein n=1 Tax=Pseudomonas agarici TaxID=46677 RepID=UPI0015A486FC|nr:hypothetical protein [Pseudomonas agarici]NWB92314.1 hypothetical protein [Pseudomonas agarici]